MARTWKTLLIYRIMDREIQRCAREYFRGSLIDIGCGTKPYKAFVQPYITQYVGLDRSDPFNPATEVDLIASAYEIPVADESFDTALSTASLEHLAEPMVALGECYRILKPGGIAIYTVPFFWHLHSEPWDYFRFSKYGLEHIFRRVGFEVVEIRALAGFWTTAATMFAYYLERFDVGIMRYTRIVPALGVIFQEIASVLDKWDRAEEWTWMYTAVGRKAG
jgi:SAM-dependent methyltransferase